MFVLLKVQSLQLYFRPAGVSLGGGEGGQGPLWHPPGYAPGVACSRESGGASPRKNENQCQISVFLASGTKI